MIEKQHLFYWNILRKWSISFLGVTIISCHTHFVKACRGQRLAETSWSFSGFVSAIFWCHLRCMTSMVKLGAQNISDGFIHIKNANKVQFMFILWGFYQICINLYFSSGSHTCGYILNMAQKSPLTSALRSSKHVDILVLRQENMHRVQYYLDDSSHHKDRIRKQFGIGPERLSPF